MCVPSNAMPSGVLPTGKVPRGPHVEGSPALQAGWQSPTLIGARQIWEVMQWSQGPFMQSVWTRQLLPPAQGGQEPPQSTSVSSPSLRLFVQDGVMPLL